MSTNSEIRKRARNALEGNWGIAVIATLIVYAVAYGLQMVASGMCTNVYGTSGSSLLLGLLTLPLVWGFYLFFLALVKGGDDSGSLGILLEGYTKNRFLTVFMTMFLVNLYEFLWFLLLIIPGIMKSLSYAMTPFILKDNPDISAVDAIHRSRVMMDGHKMKLFIMYLSFIGWGLLCLLTLGLGFLLLIPYIKTSEATFYQDLLAEEKQISNQEDKDDVDNI